MHISLKKQFILASASPRRKELLRSAGLKFKIVPASVRENYISGETPRQHVRRLAQNKAELIAAKYPDAWQGADTIVVVDGKILGKPKNKTQAKKCCNSLVPRSTEFTRDLP